MSKYCFGIDIGGTTIKCGLFDTDGNMVMNWEIVTRTEDNGSHILSDVAETIAAKMSEKSLGKDDVLGVGIGVPGPVNDEGEVLCAVNLYWDYVHIVNVLGELTGLTIKAGNDANVAALGEMWKGGGVGYKNVVMVTLGTGVGGGVINDGHIIAGANGGAGEIGHIHVEDDIDIACNCGNCGCLEQFTSATGIVKLAVDILKELNEPSSLREVEDISAKAVFDAVKAGDRLAINVAERFGKYLGKALAAIAATVDPEVFVIGGGVSKAGSVIIDYIEKYYKQYVFKGSLHTKFALAKLGNDAGIYGAVKLVIG